LGDKTSITFYIILKGNQLRWLPAPTPILKIIVKLGIAGHDFTYFANMNITLRCQSSKPDLRLSSSSGSSEHVV